MKKKEKRKEIKKFYVEVSRYFQHFRFCVFVDILLSLRRRKKLSTELLIKRKSKSIFFSTTRHLL